VRLCKAYEAADQSKPMEPEMDLSDIGQWRGTRDRQWWKESLRAAREREREREREAFFYHYIKHWVATVLPKHGALK
jgi:hypothetical protein